MSIPIFGKFMGTPTNVFLILNNPFAETHNPLRSQDHTTAPLPPGPQKKRNKIKKTCSDRSGGRKNVRTLIPSLSFPINQNKDEHFILPSAQRNRCPVENLRTTHPTPPNPIQSISGQDLFCTTSPITTGLLSPFARPVSHPSILHHASLSPFPPTHPQLTPPQQYSISG